MTGAHCRHTHCVILTAALKVERLPISWRRRLSLEKRWEFPKFQPAGITGEGWSLHADPGKFPPSLACFASLPGRPQEHGPPWLCLQVTAGPPGSPKERGHTSSAGATLPPRDQKLVLGKG